MNERMVIVKKCAECPEVGLGLFSRKKYICLPLSEQKDFICPEEGIPDCCPLPSMPEYSPFEDKWHCGWNACLDMILREEEE